MLSIPSFSGSESITPYLSTHLGWWTGGITTIAYPSQNPLAAQQHLDGSVSVSSDQVSL